MPTDTSPPAPPKPALPHPAKPKKKPASKRSRIWIPAIIVVAVAVVALVGFLLRHHAEAKTNHVALSATPKQVTVARAETATFRPTHRYVGTLRPWVEAKVGPQFISSYVSTVLVRPGAVVTRGQILGTLDCRDASARSRAIDLEARALQSQQVALATQAQRMTGLLDGGYIAANEVDLNSAQSNSERARVAAERSTLVDAQLSVSDCVLRAPFDGDIGERWVDPGAFVRPGEAVVSVVDRTVVRLVVDVPESDFSAVAPKNDVEIRILSLNQTVHAPIARRSPEADPSTRTIHIEIDLPDPEHRIPVNTTAEILVGVGQPVQATKIPLIGADLNGEKAKLFTVDDSIAHDHTLPVLGEVAGDLFIDPKLLAPGAEVVLEGRAALRDKDKVVAKEAQPPSAGDGGTIDGGRIDGGPTSAQLSVGALQ
jgi:RND family efflux transporter MFP subunit